MIAHRRRLRIAMEALFAIGLLATAFESHGWWLWLRIATGVACAGVVVLSLVEVVEERRR